MEGEYSVLAYVYCERWRKEHPEDAHLSLDQLKRKIGLYPYDKEKPDEIHHPA